MYKVNFFCIVMLIISIVFWDVCVVAMEAPIPQKLTCNVESMSRIDLTDYLSPACVRVMSRAMHDQFVQAFTICLASRRPLLDVLVGNNLADALYFFITNAYSIMEVSTDQFNFFLHKDYSFLIKDNKVRFPLLHYAACRGDLALVKALIIAAPEMLSKMAQGFSSLHIALREKQHAVAMYLIERGADVYTTDFYGLTPFNYAALAAQEGHREIADLLGKMEAKRSRYAQQHPIGGERSRPQTPLHTPVIVQTPALLQQLSRSSSGLLHLPPSPGEPSTPSTPGTYDILLNMQSHHV